MNSMQDSDEERLRMLQGLHVAGRLAFHARAATLRIHSSWPWATALVDAFARARALPAPA